jgi:hypothetical protein
LHIISQVDPMTYNLLYQCSKLFHQNEDKMMDLFTQTYVYYDIKGDKHTHSQHYQIRAFIA